ITETIPPGSNSGERTVDLCGSSLNLRGNSGLVYNTIVQSYTFALSASATTYLIVPGGTTAAHIEVTYSGITPDYVEGYFGQQTIDIAQDTAYIGLTENFRASNFMLSEATMDFSILNEFGAEFSGYLGNNKSINNPNNNSVTL